MLLKCFPTNCSLISSEFCVIYAQTLANTFVIDLQTSASQFLCLQLVVNGMCFFFLLRHDAFYNGRHFRKRVTNFCG